MSLPLQEPFTVKDHDSIISDVTAYSVFSISFSFLLISAYQRWSQTHQFAQEPRIKSKYEQIWVYVQFPLVVVQIGGWTTAFSSMLDYTFYLYAGLKILTWIGTGIMLLISPPISQFSSRFFIVWSALLYSSQLIHSIYTFLTISSESQFMMMWSNMDCAICLGLTFISLNVPFPLNPEDTKASEKDAIDVRNGCIYRNDVPLLPQTTASILSRSINLWMNDFMTYYYNNALSLEDFYALPCEFRSKYLHSLFKFPFKTSKFKLLWKIIKANGVLIIIGFTARALLDLIYFSSIYFEQQFIGYIEDPNRPPIKVAYGYLFGICIAALGQLVCRSFASFSSVQLDNRIRSMLETELYAKILRRKDTSGFINKKKSPDDGKSEKENESPSYSNSGKITNLFTNDVNKISSTISYKMHLVLTPLNLFIVLFYLYQLLGTASLCAIFVTIALLPLSKYTQKIEQKLYKSTCEASDERVNTANEMLRGVRLIKYFSWEGQWLENVLSARKLEVKQRLKMFMLQAFVEILLGIVRLLVTVLTFAWYTKISGYQLTASIAFTGLTLMNQLQPKMRSLISIASVYAQLQISLSRLIGFFDEPVIESRKRQIVLDPSGNNRSVEDDIARIGFEDSVFQWHSSLLSHHPSTTSTISEQPRYFKLSVPALDFPIEKLSIVFGPTGGGKSSLLYALLGEMDILSGQVYLPSLVDTSVGISCVDTEHSHLHLDKIAFAPQQPFLQNMSIRDNILFGEPFDPHRYKMTLFQCALLKDLELLPDHDLTEIGEKGITLSGGQKQRISVARAVYSRSKTVLLDDCFSSVDAYTAKHIYEHCICKGLMKGRTVILVTNNVQLCLPHAAFFIHIENGNVVRYGGVDTLQETKPLESLVQNHDTDKKTYIDTDKDVEDGNDASSLDSSSNDIMLLSTEISTRTLVQKEEQIKGNVNRSLYYKILKTFGGWPFWITLIIILILSNVFSAGQRWWLTKWTSVYDHAQDVRSSSVSTTSTVSWKNGSTALSTLPGDHQLYSQNELGRIQTTLSKNHIPTAFDSNSPNLNYYITIYFLLNLAYSISSELYYIILRVGALSASTKLFQDMVSNLLYVPIRFYDTTPIGRILNRLSNDISVVDSRLYSVLASTIGAIGMILTPLAVMNIILPEFIIFPVLAFISAGRVYMNVSRELNRISSASNSPKLSLYTESIDGISTLRAFAQENRFMERLCILLDNSVSARILQFSTSQWFSTRMNAIGIVLTTAAGVLILLKLDVINPGLAAICLLYSRRINSSVTFFVGSIASLEAEMTAVERIHEYIELELEPPHIIEGRRPPAAWPTTAAVEVRDLEVRYAADSDPVLHAVSFDVRPCERIGIVGRTGSGKSTLALSLFRFVDATKGSITIDGINIHDIGLHDLRSKLTMIPQDPHLFSGTVRSNLDPFSDHDDDSIWGALVRVHLACPSRIGRNISGTQTGYFSISSLDQAVSEGGSNFSQGERQLLCLARALIRKCKIIIMDEATASVDFETDQIVQKTIRDEFTDVTLICIAHRLRTIIDYDRVLVLDAGRVIEYDSPYNLLTAQDTNGTFRALCERSDEIDVLIELAQKAHFNNKRDFTKQDDHRFVK